jgi:hypothetical protein
MHDHQVPGRLAFYGKRLQQRSVSSQLRSAVDPQCGPTPRNEEKQNICSIMHVDRRAVGAVVVPIGLAHDPLNQAVARILETGLLGAPLHAFFENHASDTPLGPGHCFWNPEISGGIFIEHGVNFFDLFRMWFRPMNYSGVALERNPNGSGLCFIDP